MHYFHSFGFLEETWYMVLGFLGVSITAALVESHPISTELDDNLTVPLTSFLVGSLVFWCLASKASWDVFFFCHVLTCKRLETSVKCENCTLNVVNVNYNQYLKSFCHKFFVWTYMWSDFKNFDIQQILKKRLETWKTMYQVVSKLLVTIILQKEWVIKIAFWKPCCYLNCHAIVAGVSIKPLTNYFHFRCAWKLIKHDPLAC